MNNEQIDKLNEAISIISEACDMYAHCYNCPMRHNCSATCPARWEDVPYDHN